MSSARLHLAVALLVTLAACGGSPPQQESREPSHPAPQTTQPRPAAPQTPVPSSSSAPSSFAAARPMPVVEAVYRFAAEHPEVLSKMPCFCGCENRGHKHNDDCFVATRDQRGRVTAWEPHGIG